ncbi:reverse transcriptase domain-containing protein [Tanacetum coccineum]
MSATRQGMSSAKIEHFVAQRVTNAFEAIAIYETKIHVAHDSMDRVTRQGAKLTLDVSYAVELADEKVIGADTILRGCTLNSPDHSFNIDLMPVELDSFDVIIGMDWLSKYHAVIVCD